MNEFRELSKGNKNYVAVVHIDGNQMGKKLNKLKDEFKYEDCDYKEINKEYLKALKKFSDDIKLAFESSFKHMAEEIKRNENDLAQYTKIKEDKFPLIPIIIAGDDITYVTNGMIGIESARIFLEHLNSFGMDINGETIKLNACAGVAIVRAGYQFYKAYELAEDLCSNAKKQLLKDYENTDADYSLIDWHIEQGDIIGPILNIREDYYKSLDGKKLNMRPLYINNPEKWTNYKNFLLANSYITKLQIDEKQIARSKLKKLREILKKGEKETEFYLLSNQISNYFPRFKDACGDYCFYDDRCMYYDSIEAMDLFIELQKEG
ncbi:Cas10/Cmr2 second palm domain-containing protein [Paratissierella segnis]|uniref:Cas10/Cmr2 second palm domain-containing protein n=1 Tax=Paratissierella segnis TaxID=2763679 RepID=UPI0037424397